MKKFVKKSYNLNLFTEFQYLTLFISVPRYKTHVNDRS